MKLAVAIIHGIGSQSPTFADATIEEISRWLIDLGKDPTEVAWQPIYWADILGPRQKRYLDRARATNELDFIGLRKFVVEALGDAAAYQFVGGNPSSTYLQIRDRIRDRMHDLYSGPLNAAPVPLVVLGHSLGSHIISSYLWDTQHQSPTGADPAADPFERMEWLAGLITFGSNIPLFTFAYDPVEAIDFPGSAIPHDVAAKARWLNYFDKDDVLGYPLKPTSPSYAAVVDDDIEINVGGFATSATPLSHVGYWTDDDFTKPVARYLAEFL